MRSAAPLFSIAILLACGSRAGAQTPTAAPSADAKPASISGRITAADSGKPLRRARITITPSSESAGFAPIITNTNASGFFVAKTVAAGSYYVAAARAGSGGGGPGVR